jgi:hypothetical protein
VWGWAALNLKLLPLDNMIILAIDFHIPLAQNHCRMLRPKYQISMY